MMKYTTALHDQSCMRSPGTSNGADYNVTQAILSGMTVERNETFPVGQTAEQIVVPQPEIRRTSVVAQLDLVIVPVELADQLVAVAALDIEVEADQVVVLDHVTTNG
jgi:hypothetical protein